MSVRLVTSEHIETMAAINISWEMVISKLSAIGIFLGFMPEIIKDDPSYKAIVVADAYFVHGVISREEARYLLLTLTEVPNKVLANIIMAIDIS